MSKQVYFWDSCVFYKYLNATPANPTADLVQYITDAQQGKIQLLCSTLAFAEVRPSALIKKGFDTIDDFLDDVKGVFEPVAPTPDIMKKAAILKDRSYEHSTKKARPISTPDAIQLLTCLYASEDLGLSNIVFHTFDDGGGKGWEGKCVPLLSFEEWIVGCENVPLVGKIAAMPRHKPELAQVSLPLNQPNAE